MLETPLYGRFIGENKKLVFGPVGPYTALVRACVIGGCLVTAVGVFAPPLGVELPIYDAWWVGLGVAVALAGIAVAFSLQSVVFDLRERIYRRRQGPGLIPKTTRGRVSDLDAVVLIAEPNSLIFGGGVTYHLVLHWKGQREPVLVLQQDTRPLPAGQPMNAATGPLHQRGMQYARALGVPFYDNSHFPSPNPFPIWQ